MFSIVIPTKNEEYYLPFLLKSLKKQTLKPKQIIVADAFSSDRTREIAQSFGCEVVDGGLPGSGRNRGASCANQPWIIFLDADVEFEDPTFLERAYSQLQTRDLDLATCSIRPISNRRIDHFFHTCYNVYTRACQPFMVHAPGLCIFIKRQLHEQINGFDETIIFCEDHEYAKRASKIGRFGFLSKDLHVPVSIRRLKRDGYIHIAGKYFLSELHLLFLGPIRDNKFKYDLDYKKDERV